MKKLDSIQNATGMTAGTVVLFFRIDNQLRLRSDREKGGDSSVKKTLWHKQKRSHM
jgi:hypothetical protein